MEMGKLPDGRGGHGEGVVGCLRWLCPTGLFREAYLAIPAWSEVEAGIKIRKAVSINQALAIGADCFGLFGSLDCH